MIEINVTTNFGFLVGFSIADREECEEFEISWGFTLSFGIFAITLCKHSGPGEEKPA